MVALQGERVVSMLNDRIAHPKAIIKVQLNLGVFMLSSPYGSHVDNSLTDIGYTLEQNPAL